MADTDVQKIKVLDATTQDELFDAILAEITEICDRIEQDREQTQCSKDHRLMGRGRNDLYALCVNIREGRERLQRMEVGADNRSQSSALPEAVAAQDDEDVYHALRIARDRGVTGIIQHLRDEYGYKELEHELRRRVIASLERLVAALKVKGVDVPVHLRDVPLGWKLEYLPADYILLHVTGAGQPSESFGGFDWHMLGNCPTLWAGPSRHIEWIVGQLQAGGFAVREIADGREMRLAPEGSK